MAGVTPVASIMASKCSGSKLDTPIERIKPYFRAVTNARHALQCTLPRLGRPVDQKRRQSNLIPARQ